MKIARQCLHPISAVFIAGFSLALVLPSAAGDPLARLAATLEQQLLAEKPEALVRDALRDGDPIRGAIVFFQPYLSCTKCHSAGEEANRPLGPDLARLQSDATPAHLVEALLEPSKTIRKGFEPVTLLLKDGKTASGILIEESPQPVVFRDAADDGRTVTGHS